MLKLPEKQEMVWELYLKKTMITRIAEKMNISKQAVSLYLRQARAKLAEIFLSLASTMDLAVIKIDTEKGVLIGKIRQTGERVYVFYIPSKGPVTVYQSVLEKDNIPEDSNCEYLIDFYARILNIDKEKRIKVLREAVKDAETI